MSVRVDRALYGLTEDGHTLIETTLASPPAVLERLSDRPHGTVHAEAWEPFFAATNVDGYFALLRVERDDSASRRGAVRTRAVITTQDGLERTDLVPLFNLLEDGNWESKLTPVFLDAYPEQPSLTELSQEDFNFTHRLIDAAGEPAIVSAHGLLRERMVNLWRSLPARGRKAFSFRTLFDPDDLNGLAIPTLLVVIPSSQMPLWSSYFQARGEYTSSMLARHLAGDAQPEVTRWLDFLEPWSWNALTLVDVLVRHIAAIPSAPAPIKPINGALAILNVLNFTSTMETTERQTLEAQLLAALKTASVVELELVARLKLHDPKPIQDALAARVQVLAHEIDGTLSKLLQRLYVTEPSPKKREIEYLIAPWWEAGVLGAMHTLLRTPDVRWCRDLWTMLKTADAKAVLDLLPDTWEDALGAEYLDNTPVPALEKALENRHWWSLRAIVAFASDTQPNPKLYTKLLRDAPLRAVTAITRAYAKRHGLSNLVHVAMGLPKGNKDWQTKASASQIATGILLGATQDAWKALEVNPSGLAIWTAAIQSAVDPWGGEALRLRPALITALTDGLAVPTTLLESLGRTDGANLVDVSNRALVWAKLPPTACSLFLEATVNGWFVSEEGDAEEPLRMAILRRIAKPEFTAAEARRVLVFAARLNGHQYERLLDVALSKDDSALGSRIGATLVECGDEGFTHALYKRVQFNGRATASSFVSAVLPLLPPLERFLASFGRKLEGSSGSQALEALEAWCIEHVPFELEDLWQEAGGRAADVPDGSTPAARWHRGFARVRSGGGFDPEALIRVLRVRFKASEELAKISEALHAKRANDLSH